MLSESKIHHQDLMKQGFLDHWLGLFWPKGAGILTIHSGCTKSSCPFHKQRMTLTTVLTRSALRPQVWGTVVVIVSCYREPISSRQYIEQGVICFGSSCCSGRVSEIEAELHHFSHHKSVLLICVQQTIVPTKSNLVFPRSWFASCGSGSFSELG